MMRELIKLVKIYVNENRELPFSTYSAPKEQLIANVPIIKPLLIFILGGVKHLGPENTVCSAGTFVFLSNNQQVDMRNIPGDEDYLAVLIEFEYANFDQFKLKQKQKQKMNYFKGDINKLLEVALKQYIELSMLVSPEKLNFRKQELLQLIYLSGYKEVSAIAEPPNLSQKVYDVINQDITNNWGAEKLAAGLFMSESTLRRKLKIENTSVKEIRNRVRLGYGLHLIQTTIVDVGQISMRCGYLSQSTFTKQFKALFNMTPTALRKTRMLKN